MTIPDYKQSGGATLGNSGNNTSSSSGGRGLMGTVKEKLDNVRYVRSRDKSSKDSTSSSSGAARKSARLGQIDTSLKQFFFSQILLFTLPSIRGYFKSIKEDNELIFVFDTVFHPKILYLYRIPF